VGAGSEHHRLYNYNFDVAQNLFAGMLQVETPYYQGAGCGPSRASSLGSDLQIGDPDFHWCSEGDGKCRMW